MSAVGSSSKFPLTTLRVAITGESNLSCFYDKSLGRHIDWHRGPEKLGPGEYNKITKAAGEAGIERILIAGCEPLLRKDVASVVKAFGNSKKVQEVRFITNGIFLKDYADSLRRSGLKHIEINLDSLNFMAYQKITRRDGLYRVLDGLQKCERIKFDSLTLNVILMRGINDRELIDFAIMTKTRAIHIRFIEYNPINSAPVNRQLHFPLLQAKRVIQDFQQLQPTSDNGADQGQEIYRFKNAAGVISFIDLRASHLTAAHPRLVLNCQGILYIDHPSSKHYDLLKELDKESPEEKLTRLFAKVIAPSNIPKTASVPERSRRAREAHA